MAKDGWARHMSWRVHNGDEIDVAFDGRIDIAEDLGEGLVHISGALSSGHRCVLVTADAGLHG